MTNGAGCCPICGRAADTRYKPFCSSRCANVDLSRWLNESYRIPARTNDDEEESPSGSTGPSERAPPDEENDRRGTKDPHHERKPG